MIFFSTDVSLFPAESVFLFFLPFFSPLLLTSRLINVSGRIRMDIPTHGTFPNGKFAKFVKKDLEALSLSGYRVKIKGFE